MTDKAKKIVDALRADCYEQGSCPDCAANEWCHGNATKPLDDYAADMIEALSAQFEAAVYDMRLTRHCDICKHHRANGGDCCGVSCCGYGRPGWEWRGVQEA